MIGMNTYLQRVEPRNVNVYGIDKACVSANYATLKTMYAQRRNHRNPEWRIFCGWVETLPKAIALGVTSVLA